ncbi:MAG: murein L,D-transpeptidase family protein [Lachnospiraceae bacterium]
MKNKKWNYLLFLFILLPLLTGCTEQKGTDSSASAVQMESESMFEEVSEASLEFVSEEMSEEAPESVSEEAPEEASEEMTKMNEPYIVIVKSERTLSLYQPNGSVTAVYSVGLAQNPIGAKEKEGDKKTPEGEYYICVKNEESRFHRALGLSYPNIQDAERGLASDLISEAQKNSIVSSINAGIQPDWYTPLGGEIMIHGQKGDLGSQSDWTTGCIALNNEDIDSLWDQVELGTIVIIKP